MFSRPWYGLWIATVALIYGAIVLLFLHGAMYFARNLAEHATIVGMGFEANQQLWDSVEPIPGQTDGVPPTASIGGKLRAMWAKGFMTLSTVFVYSYFWVAMTIAYFLLRHAEDATPFRKVYWNQPDESSPTAPALSGMAAAEFRERQLQPAPAPPAAEPPVPPPTA